MITEPTENMRAVLERLATEDAGLGDPTQMVSQHGRALAEMNNLRWNEALPAVAKARTVLHAGMPARWILPENDAGTAAILHVHGGGWAFCSALSHEGAARRLAIACRCPVLTFDYRLAPEHPYPAGLEDVLRAWAARDPARQWSLAGDSAGANLALAAMLELVGEGAELPRAALLFYGVYGADFTTPSYQVFADGPGLTRGKMQRYWDWYAPEDLRGDPCLAPLHADQALLRGLPPLYLNAAGIDPLRSDSELLLARLEECGRADRFDLVEGVVHGFIQMGSLLPEARQAFERAGRAFREITA